MNRPRVAFITSHPIQYQVPVFRALAERDDLDFKVFFGMIPDAQSQGKGFGVSFQWDIPLLVGYDYEILENVSRSPSVITFRGCDTPKLGQSLGRYGATTAVVNGWVVKSCLQALSWCRSNRIPCFVRGEANHLRPRPWWKRVLQKRLVRKFSGALPIGKANRAFYESYGLGAHQMFEAPYCVDNQRFRLSADAARPNRESIRRKWNIGSEATCFLYCAKFEPKKHPRELILAFLAASQESVESKHLLLVGDGELRQECEQIVKDWHSQVSQTNPERATKRQITFAGFLNQSEIIDAYVASDCLVLPSDFGETWGLVVNEAFATGLPAIVSDQVGCNLDLIISNETGFVFKFGAWNELTKHIAWCAENRDKLATMGQNAQKLIERYSPTIAANGIAAAAKSVVHGK